jgi:hypothetical protein
MNRAWIPAGALASVSVAGLLALGPLTDSMGTKVSFPVSVSAPKQSPASTTDVPVKYDVDSASGVTQTAALARGGESESFTPNTDTGQVGFHVRSSGSATSKVKITTKAATKASAKKKKVTKRATSITGIGETNSTSGLTGGSGASTDLGEQAPTPSSDTP